MILLPVIVLVVVGIYSLKQDKAIAEKEAAGRAQAIAEDLEFKIWNELTACRNPDQSPYSCFEVSRDGQLFFPPPYSQTPTPRPLTGNSKSELWFTAQETDRNGKDSAAAIRGWRDFLATAPPPDFNAIARYRLGNLLLRTGDTNGAFRELEAAITINPDAVSESGLALKPMAELSLLETGIKTNLSFEYRYSGNHQFAEEFISCDSVCSNFVYNPTCLSAYLLHKVSEIKNVPDATSSSEKWLQVWQNHEWARQLFAAAEPQIRTDLGLAALVPEKSKESFRLTSLYTARQMEMDRNRHLTFPSSGAVNYTSSAVLPASLERTGPLFLWFNVPILNGRRDTHWLAVRTATDLAGYHFVCFRESDIGKITSQLVGIAKPMPEYFGVGIEVAGRKISAGAPDLHLWDFEDYHTRGSDGQKRKNQDQLAKEVLASAAKFEGGAEALKISVYLTSPGALYKQQQARTIWFGALIGASALAALVGFLAAYRAFRRQLHLSEMKSNFVSSVSHELRAPIASVRLMAEGLERGKIQDAQKQYEYFRFITQECRRLSSLIENVLDFSRIEQGRKQYEMESTDLVALTTQTVKLMETYAAEQQVSITLAIQGNPKPLELDCKAMQQALINLIDNAIKHSPRGARVEVGVEFEEDNEISESSPASNPPHATRSTHRVQLRVEDQGEGIPASEHEKIFERFYRVGSELRRQTQGVGIGLSIVKHIVEAHGGKVIVRSAPGEGSRFTILLP